MSIEINTGTRGINWETLLSPLGDVAKTDSVDGRQSFTITTKVDGETRTLSVSIPDDLEVPETVDQGTLNGLVDKLQATGLGFTDEQVAKMKDAIAQIYAEAEAAAVSFSSSSTGKVLFDLYALMALMIEVAQSQRDAARQMRTAENLAVQKAIQNQADDQRAAAMVGMIVGITCGLASAVVSIGTMIGQGINAKAQSKIMAESGADASKMHVDAFRNTDTVEHAQTQLQNTMMDVGDGIAGDVIHTFEQRTTDPQLGNLRNALNEAVQNNTSVQMTLEAKRAELQTAQEVVPTKQAEVDAAQATVTEKTTALEQAQAEFNEMKTVSDAARAKQQYIAQEMNAKRPLDPQKIAEFDAAIGGPANLEKAMAASGKLETAKQDLATAQQTLQTKQTELQTANQTVQTKQGDVQIAQQEATTASAAVDKARSDYVGSVRSLAEEYQSKYQEAVARQSSPPEGMTKQELSAAVDKAKAEMKIAFAVEADLLAKDGVMTPTVRSNMVKDLNAKVDIATQTTYQRADFKSAERKMTTLMGINNINQAIGGVMQSTASNLASLRSAEATRAGADSKKEEEMLDQTKDLFSQEQKLIDQVIQLFSNVIQAENQSMRDAIQA